MSFGSMNTRIEILEKQVVTDEEGFPVETKTTIASVQAYLETQHGSEKWANRATFTDATALFRFRSIPGLTVTTAMVIACIGKQYEITSVEDIKSRGMYVEVLAKEVQPSGKVRGENAGGVSGEAVEAGQ